MNNLAKMIAFISILQFEMSSTVADFCFSIPKYRNRRMLVRCQYIDTEFTQWGLVIKASSKTTPKFIIDF
jgi:hypothetical protein